MVSIVIPLYNKEKQVANTLQTVFNQTFQDFEIVIVNDGSTDKSIEEVEKFNDLRIRLIYQENAGVSAARNRGIQESKYDYIALLDADDEWYPGYLQEQVNLIYNYSECSVFACAYEFKTYKGELKPIKLDKIPFSSQTGILTNYFEIASCSHPPLWTSAVVVEKKAILSVGGFPVGIKSGEDLLTWACLAARYSIAYNRRALSVFNLSSSESYDNAPSRVPEKDDYVGVELKRLYEKNKTIVGLKNYVALWFKMRASIFLLFDDKKNTLKEALKSLKYNPFNIRVWAYILLLIFPKSFKYKIFQTLGNQ